MNAFVSATQKNQVYGKTYNGADTLNTSSNPVVDMFFAAGNRDIDLSKEFDLAYRHDKKLAYRVALWTRDIRGGAGERKTFRNLLLYLEQHYSDDLLQLLPKIPEVGRWDDLLIFKTPKVMDAAFYLYKEALDAGNGLAAKWFPRKGTVFVQYQKYTTLTPKQLRKKLVSLTKVVEQQMCSKEWDKINFNHVPSVASARYQKAFLKHCGQAYQDYRASLVKQDGTVKINAGAVYPYDVIRSIRSGDRDVAVAQWNALPNFLGDNKILPMIDVSGSMFSWSYYGKRKAPKFSMSPLDIAVSLGLYVASKQTGDFHGMYLTFSTAPKLKKLSGDLISMMRQIETDNWSMSTNIQAAFDEILNLALTNNVSQDDLPKILLIVSDMEFDSCVHNNTGRNINYDVAKKKFTDAGYELPKVVFWNLNGRSDNVPVSFRENGTALISGFSPSIFKSVVSDNLSSFTPENVMLDALSDKRYDIPGLTV